MRNTVLKPEVGDPFSKKKERHVGSSIKSELFYPIFFFNSIVTAAYSVHIGPTMEDNSCLGAELL